MIDDPLNVFFADFGIPVTVETATGPCEILGIFDEPFINQMLGSVDMDTTHKRITCKSTDVSGVVRESIVRLMDQSFSVVRKEPDGTGLTVLYLTAEGDE